MPSNLMWITVFVKGQFGLKYRAKLFKYGVKNLKEFFEYMSRSQIFD